MYLYIDIETIPTQRQDFIDELSADISPPGNYKSPETISKWTTEKKPDLIEKAVSVSSFDGGMGEIVAISYAIDDGDIQSFYRDGAQSLEIPMLIAFRDSLPDMRPTWVGHYITGFDLRFLWKRFVIHNIDPIVKIPYNAKPWGGEVFDTCHEWKQGSQDKGSLDFVCRALGIEGKNGMDGSQVYDYWKAGKYKEISDYCADDVKKVREIHKRLIKFK